IGGTGKIGRPTARALAELGASVRVLNGYETKAAQLEGSGSGFFDDLSRSYSVAPAFNGIDTLVLITSHCITETGQGLSAVANALAAGVRRIVFLSSSVGPGSMRIPHVASKAPIEHALITSRVEYTIVRAHSLFQNDRAVEDAIVSNGKYSLPYGSAGVSRIDVRDVAAALANAAMKPGHDRRIYTLGTPERWTGDSI